ncbi:MAG: hypothetical protein ACYCS1_11515 [Gammaproteobacteria bacterium]
MNTLWRHEVHTLETGESLAVRLGAPRLIAERFDSEWNFYWSDDSAREMLPAIHFAPNLANRPLIIRPVMPLYIPPAPSGLQILFGAA